MKHQYIIQSGHPRLLVFFAGWASDPTPFQDYRPAGRDYVVCYDYRTLENDFIPHGTYHEADIVAWSMGVWAASHVVPMLDVPIGKSIAINGTPYPIDAGRGIPPAIWQGTLDNLSPLSLHKFTRRMCADTEAFHRFLRVTPRRPVDELAEEMRAITRMLDALPALNNQKGDPWLDAMFSGQGVGQTLTITGPCGNGFDTAAAAAAGRVAVVGGGIGVAPLLLLCKELSAAGPKPELYVGFRDEPYGLEAFLPYCGAISVATDSGAAGYHGLVTGILHPENFDLVLACGPTPMMRGVAALCKEKGVRCLVSLERKMACGLGACLGCTCQTKVGPRTVCKDGPVFSAEEVFDLD